MKKILKNFLYRNGYKVNKVSKNNLLNDNPLLAINGKVGDNPIIFDIRANLG